METDMVHEPLTKTIGGVTFEEPYPWLFEDTPEALDWQWARDEEAKAYARAYPRFQEILDRLRNAREGEEQSYSAPRKRGGRWFRQGGAAANPAAIVSDEPLGDGETLVTTEEISKRRGGKAMLSWTEVSPKGTYLAYAYGVDGDMLGDWSVMRVADRHNVKDLPAQMYTGARPGWLPDESGFYLDGRTSEGLHELKFVPIAPGVAERPSVVFPESLVEAKHSGLTAQISPDGRRAVVVTEPHEHIAVAMLDLETGEAKPFLPDGWASECDGSWIDNETYAARVGDVQHGRVVAIPLASSRDPKSWRTIVPEGDGFIAWVGVVSGKVYAGDFVDVSLRIRVFGLDGQLLKELPLEAPGSSPTMFIERAIRPTEALSFSHATFTRAPVFFAVDPDSLELRQISKPGREMKGMTVEPGFAVSTGGVRVPYFVVRRSDLDRSQAHPALFYGYGGFNVALLPTFVDSYSTFLEAGGIYVHCCLRGGAEYGKAWHDAGRLKNKQRTFDDLFAIAEKVIEDGLSTPDRMAIQGGSNGGLLAAAAAVQRPDLWRAAVPNVPIMDMMEPLPLTAETAPVRAIFYEDYGDPQKPEDAASIIKWSPYHNIKEGVRYPAVFQVFGETDLGCLPHHGRRFTARLRDSTTSGRPIHLRVWRNVGHGSADPDIASQQSAEMLSFVMNELGLN
jgi:prolyl oligopeptidase